MILIKKGFQNNNISDLGFIIPTDTTYLFNPLPNELQTPIHGIEQCIRILMENHSSFLNEEGINVLLNMRSLCLDALTMIQNPVESVDGSIFLLEEEKKIITMFKNKDESLISHFETVLTKLFHFLKKDPSYAEIISKRFYHTIILHVFKEFSWINNFLPLSFFDENYCFSKGDLDDAKNFYLRRISTLIRLIINLSLPLTDVPFQEIIHYILMHPDGDLRLKTLAAYFFINSTYLSNTFHIRTGLHYNDYITKVKMARAEYLFQYTDLKIYEICYQLGYKDMNYFSKQFKKHYGLNPTEYRNKKSHDYQI